MEHFPVLRAYARGRFMFYGVLLIVSSALLLLSRAEFIPVPIRGFLSSYVFIVLITLFTVLMIIYREYQNGHKKLTLDLKNDIKKITNSNKL